MEPLVPTPKTSPRPKTSPAANVGSVPGDREFALGNFLARWNGRIRHNLSPSDSATLSLSALLAMADIEDQHRWQALDLGYADPHGAPWLREAIANRYAGMDAATVLCCAGAQEGLACVMSALLTTGDHAIVALPIYQPSEQSVTRICNATGVPLRYQNGWQLDPAEVAAAIRPATRVVLLNFPNSPTGASIDPAILRSLVEICRSHGLWLVNDEVYRPIGSGPASDPPAVGQIYERGISVDAVSKGFGLPGLRVGWILCQDRNFLAKALLAKSALSSCLATPSEVLAHIALKAEVRIGQRNKAVAQFNQERLRILLGRHSDILELPASSQSVLAFPRYHGRGDTDRFVTRLAQEAGVLALPSRLWQSPLADMPADRLRIGLGRIEAAAALDAMDIYLTSHRGFARGA